MSEPAARSWLEAAEMALNRSAIAEANHHIDAGLALLPQFKAGTDRDELELALRVARANTSAATSRERSASLFIGIDNATAVSP
jgi:hypothetical protein